MLQTFLLLAALVGACLLIARMRRSVSVFVNLVLAIAIGMLVGSNVDKYVLTDGNTIDTEYVLVDDSADFTPAVAIPFNNVATIATATTFVTTSVLLKELAHSILSNVNPNLTSNPDKGKPLLTVVYHDTS